MPFRWMHQSMITTDDDKYSFKVFQSHMPDEDDNNDGDSPSYQHLQTIPTLMDISGTTTAATTISGRTISDSDLWEAAATVTQQSCQLLGIKSIGVDYGLARTGVATTVGYDPTPLAILSNIHLNSTQQVCREIVKFAQSELASQIVVGLPLHKNGTEANQTIITRHFAAELATHVLRTLGPTIPVYMWDERYTSKFAAARAQSMPKKQNNNNIHDDNRSWQQKNSLYGTLDADAACIILEHFYSKNGKNAQRVELPQQVQDECLQEWEASQREQEQRKKAAMEARVGGRSSQRQESMERARQLEAEMQQKGLLGISRKQQKKKKKKRDKRGPWLTPGTSATISAAGEDNNDF